MDGKDTVTLGDIIEGELTCSSFSVDGSVGTLVVKTCGSATETLARFYERLAERGDAYRKRTVNVTSTDPMGKTSVSARIADPHAPAANPTEDR